MTATRADALQHAMSYFDGDGFESELARRVAIHTESQRPESFPELGRYLDEEMIPAFKSMDFTTQVFDNPVEGCGPVLLATREENATATTVLGYGHGDVIQGLDDQWTKGSGPWVTARDGDRLYGRGTADNKGQHTINMAALRSVIETRGRLGFNAKFMIEMGEENGSRGLRDVMAANKPAFAADVFIASDGPRISPDKPTLSLGCRGAENFDLVVRLRDGGHHSGNWGGLLADPAMILAQALATITDAHGTIRIPEWRPPSISPAVREVLKGLEISAGADGPKIDADWGEPGLTAPEKVYAWNSFAVLAMTSGNPKNPVNAIAPWARANCQLRFVSDTDGSQILPALRRHLDAHYFGMVEIKPPPASNAGGFTASRTEPDHPWVLRVRESVAQTIGGMPAVIPSMGGSICNELFTELLGIPAIWLPHSYTACSQHAPDEHILMPMTRDALQIMTGLYWDLGQKQA